MADDSRQPAAQTAPSAAGAPAATGGRIDWKAVLPVPLLLTGLVLLAGGVIAGVLRAPKVSPAVPLEAARIAYGERKFEEALGVLNDTVRPAVAAGRLAGAGERDFHLLRARVVSGLQAARGVRTRDNDGAIVSDFERAKTLGAEWTEEDQGTLAEALVGAGRTADAVAMAKALPAEQAARRQAILKRIVDANLRGRDPRVEETLALLNDLAEDPAATPDDHAWALARQAELRMRSGFPQEAATRLLRALPKAQGLSVERRGELVYLLGSAYERMGDLAGATAQLEAAEAILPGTSPVRARALVLAGRLRQARGELDEARERFRAVVENPLDEAAKPEALLGLAETLAGLGDDDGAVERYRELLDRIEARAGGVSGPEAGASLMDRTADRQAAGALGLALRYALLAERAYRGGLGPVRGPARPSVVSPAAQADAGVSPAGAAAPRDVLDPVPPAVFLALGSLHRALGEQQIAEARATDAGRISVHEVSPVTQAEVKRHLLDAGAAYREHARLVLVSDDAAHADSLWAAGECFDLAGDRESAQACLALYTRRGDEDPRRAEAVFRLAQGFEAQRDFATAASRYRELVDAGAGPVSLRAVVPLARCAFADDQPGNDTGAEEMIERLLASGVVAPEAEVYRDGLIELGERAHRTGRYPAAISRLGEAVARYPDHERAGVLTFKLADAMRLSAAEIDAQLRAALPQARREELERLRRERLDEASAGFARSIELLSAKDARQHTPLDRLALRNSTFYRGDVAFEQRDYQRAIVLYDDARQKYSGDPAALVAMVQIVNAYVAERRWSEAITANERARQQLASLPDSTWDDPNLPMERRHWERWLDAGRLIDRQKGDVGNSAASAEH